MNVVLRSVLLFGFVHLACSPQTPRYETRELTFRTGEGIELASQHVRTRTREFLHPRHLRGHGYRKLPAPRIQEVCSSVLSTPDGHPFAAVDESCRWIEGSGFTGSVRRLEVTPFDLGRELVVEVPGMLGALPAGWSSGPPSPFDDTLEGVGRNGWALIENDGEARVLVWSRPPGIEYDAGRLRVSLDTARTFEIALVTAGGWSVDKEHELFQVLQGEGEF